MELAEAAEQQVGHRYLGNLQALVVAEGERKVHLLQQRASAAEEGERKEHSNREKAVEKKWLAGSRHAALAR